MRNGIGDASPALAASVDCDIAIIGAGITAGLVADALIAAGNRIIRAGIEGHAHALDDLTDVGHDVSPAGGVFDQRRIRPRNRDRRRPACMPESIQTVGFCPVSRTEVARNRDTAGLGLTTVPPIALDHGGHVEPRNRSEGGLRVIVSLPLPGQ